MVKTKKALIITYNPDHSLGGTEIYAEKVINILESCGWKITEWSFDMRNEKAKIKSHNRLIVYPNTSNSEKLNIKSLINLRKSKKELECFKKNNKFDLVINNIMNGFSFEKPLNNEILVQHNDLSFYNYNTIYGNKLFSNLIKPLSKVFTGFCDYLKIQKNIVFFNNESKKETENYYKKHFTISPCIPLAEYTKNEISSFKKEDIKNRICYIGRIVKTQKNIKFLIKLAKHLNVPIDVYGNGSLVEKVKNTKNIKYCGILDHKDVLKTFAKYKASIIVSKFEGFSYSGLESVCAQTPCIIRNTFTNAEFFTSKGKGLLLDKKLSPKQCAEKINEWLQKNDFNKATKLNKEFALKNLTEEQFEQKWIALSKKF